MEITNTFKMTDLKKYNLPTELILHIFYYLPAKDLLRCSFVCKLWRKLVSELQNNENTWLEYCKMDFENIYKVAKYKSRTGMDWYNIYKNLTLWPRILSTKEKIIIFSKASNITEEILDFNLLEDGIIAIQKRQEISYFNADTMKDGTRSVAGSYLRYSENEHALVILHTNLMLFISRKTLKAPDDSQYYVQINTTNFLLKEQKVFFVTMSNEVFMCDLSEGVLKETHLFTLDINNSVTAMSYKDKLYALTYKQDIYSYGSDGLKLICKLGNKSIQILRNYNFLDTLDWRLYIQWLSSSHHNFLDGILQNITRIYVYGDIVFLGTFMGLLRVYYIPGDVDLFNSTPIKEWNLWQYRKENSSSCPILQIDVMEGRNRHTVIVALSTKMIAIDFIRD